MIPHHQGAIRMARAVGERTRNAGIKNLAVTIIATHSEEIRQLRGWRKGWYGSAEEDAMGHGGQ